MTVYTTIGEYDNMILIKNQLPRDASSGNRGRFSLDFKQNSFVQLHSHGPPYLPRKRAVKKVDKVRKAEARPYSCSKEVHRKGAAQAVSARLGLSLILRSLRSTVRSIRSHLTWMASTTCSTSGTTSERTRGTSLSLL